MIASFNSNMQDRKTLRRTVYFGNTRAMRVSTATHLALQHRGRCLAFLLEQQFLGFGCPMQLRRVQHAHTGPLLHPLTAMTTKVILNRVVHVIANLTNQTIMRILRGSAFHVDSHRELAIQTINLTSSQYNF